VVDVVLEQHQRAVVDQAVVDVKVVAGVMVHLDKALLAELELYQVQAAVAAELTLALAVEAITPHLGQLLALVVQDVLTLLLVLLLDN
jgi:hypothetical protein